MATKAVSVDELCRLCLEIADSSKCVDIIEKNLAMRIVSCVSVEIQTEDALPKRICHNCHYMLEKTHLFRAKSKDSEAKLKRHIRLVNSGKESTVLEEDDEEFDDEHKPSIDIVSEFEKSQKETFTAELQTLNAHLEAQQVILKLQHRKAMQDLTKYHEKLMAEAKQNFERSLKDQKTKYEKQNEADTSRSSQEIARLKNSQKAFADSTRKQIREEEVCKILEEAKTFLLNRTTDTTSDPNKSVSIEEYHSDEEMSQDSQTQDNRYTPTNNFLEISGSEAGNPSQQAVSSVSEEENENYDQEEIEGEPETEAINQSYESLLEPTTYEVLEYEPVATPPAKRKCKRPESTEQHFIIIGKNEKVQFADKLQCKEENLEQTTYEISTAPPDLDLELDDEEGVSESFRERFNYQDIEKAVKLTLSKSGLSYTDTPISLKYDRSADDMSKLKVEVTLANGSTQIIDFSTTDFEKPENQSLFECTQCGESFPRLGLLKSHEVAQHSQKGFRCTFCTRWWPTKSALSRHTRTHTGEKPFKCQDCGKQFVQKEILKRHMTIHTGLRPYKCEHEGCDQRFIQSDLLKQHMKRKHSENPVFELYKCYLCPKSFCHSSGLSRHLQTHAGKTFECDYCSRKFTDNSALKRHKNTIHATQFSSSIKTEG